jgi:IS30 family transposase
MSRYNLADSFAGSHATRLLSSSPVSSRESLAKTAHPHLEQGREMARHAELSVKPSIDIFVAEPHHRFERPSKKAFNGLRRR